MNLYNSFYQKNVIDQFSNMDVNDKYKIGAETLNLAAHLRHLFWSRYGVSTTFIFYYSLKEATFCKESVLNYRSSFYEKRLQDNEMYYSLNSILKKNIDIIKLISEYIPNVFFIDTDDTEFASFPYLKLTEKQIKRNTNIVLTNDNISFQLCNLPRTFILTVKGDNSKIISQDTLMKELLKGSKKKTDTILNPSFYNIVNAISGCTKYNIESKKGLGNVSVIKLLEKGISEDIISNIEYTDISEIIQLLKDNQLYNFTLDDEVKIISNYSVINYKIVTENMTPKQILNINKQFINKNNWKSVVQVNERYFHHSPIMTMELLEGEETY